MRQRAPIVAGAFAALAVASALALLVRHDRGPGAGRPLGADGFAAQVSIAPRSHMFGDAVVARIDLLVDRDVLDPDRVRVETGFGPFTQTGVERRTRSDHDGVSRIRVEYPLNCLVEECVPEKPTKDFDFAPAVIRHGRTRVGAVPWPRVTIGSRLGLPGPEALDPNRGLGFEVPWRANLRVRPPTFSIAPTPLTVVLVLLAAALLATSVYLVQIAFPNAPLGFRRLRRVKLTPLERALAVLERAHERGIEREQRLALDELARELRTGGQSELAGTARRLAWEKDVPDAERTATLSEDVRRLTTGRTNGSS